MVGRKGLKVKSHFGEGGKDAAALWMWMWMWAWLLSFGTVLLDCVSVAKKCAEK